MAWPSTGASWRDNISLQPILNLTLQDRPTTSRSERLVEEALVMKGLLMKVPPFGFPTQIAKEARMAFLVRIADY